MMVLTRPAFPERAALNAGAKREHPQTTDSATRGKDPRAAEGGFILRRVAAEPPMGGRRGSAVVEVVEVVEVVVGVKKQVGASRARPSDHRRAAAPRLARNSHASPAPAPLFDNASSGSV